MEPAEALDRLRQAGGSASGSLAEVGRAIGAKSRTTAHRVLHQLAAAGLVRLESGRGGVRVAVAG